MPKKDALITSELGAILRKARENSDLPREQVAERAEIGARYLAAIESGEKTPSVEVFCRIVRAIGVSADIVAYHETASSESEIAQLARLIRSCDLRDRRAVKAMVDALLDTKEPCRDE